MSTRSLITIENIDATYTFAYCHSDGYLSGVGCQVASMARPAIQAIIDDGDMSSIGDPYKDHGEDCPPGHVGSLPALLQAGYDAGVDYIYVIDLQGTWQYTQLLGEVNYGLWPLQAVLNGRP
jgi:hypothetical protein